MAYCENCGCDGRAEATEADRLRAALAGRDEALRRVVLCLELLVFGEDRVPCEWPHHERVEEALAFAKGVSSPTPADRENPVLCGERPDQEE